MPYVAYTRFCRSAISPVVESVRSAWVADATYAINDRWTIGASYQWDPKFGREDLASLRTRYLIGDEGIINFSYRYRRNSGYQPNLPITENNDPDLLEQADRKSTRLNSSH